MASKKGAVPNEKQKLFFLASRRFVAYGGARGGGKSWAVRKKAMMLCGTYSGIKVLILRRSYPEVRENHIIPLLSELDGVAVYKDSEKCFNFQNKSRLKFGYCDSEGDVLRYQGQEYDVIFMDEATQFSELQFKTLTACLRGANDFPKRFYLTCNPGGVGHEWVKRLFIDREYRSGEHSDDYEFIAAGVYDNHALTTSDPGYVAMLEGLPDELKRAWLHGDWNVLSGRYLTEFDVVKHVIQPFAIPPRWNVYFTMDYGLDMLAGYFIAVDEQGSAYVFRELYKKGLIISEAAAEIQNSGIVANTYLAPPDLWNSRQETGKSAAELFFEHGIVLTKAPNSRVSGWLSLREWLKSDVGEPRLRIFSGCTNLIRTLPLLCHDKRNPSDAATEPHEITHAPDALRYFCASHIQPTETYERYVWVEDELYDNE